MKGSVKVISFLVTFLILSVISVNAQIQTEVDYRTGNVKVTGFSQRQDDITIKVFKPESMEYAYFDQVKADQYGSYEINFNTESVYGPYKMVVNNGAEKLNDDIYFDIFVPRFTVKGTVNNKELNNLSELAENEGMKATLTVDYNPNQSSVEKFDAKMICAVYGDDNKLLAVKQSNTLAPKDDSAAIKEYEASAEFTAAEIAEAAMLKVFLWENGTMKPYTGVYTLNKHPYGDNLKILSIGNSFSLNSTVYINKMAEQIGIDNFVVGFTYAGGATLETHMNLLKNNTKYTYEKNSGEGFVIRDDATTREAIEDEDWDIIFIQQGSIESGNVDSYKEEYIAYLTTAIKQYAKNPDVKIGWHMTWPYTTGYQYSSTEPRWESYYNKSPEVMFEKIVHAVKTKIVPDDRFSYILYSGPAIWNARNCLELTSIPGVGQLSHDGQHISAQGSVVAGMAWLRSLGYDISKVDASCAEDLEITERQLELMKSAVNKAYENPFVCSKID